MTIGLIGSPAHITTNKNMTGKEKLACHGEILKEGLKDTLKLTAGVAGAAGIGAAASKSGKFVNALKGVRHSIGDKLSKVTINGENLKDTVLKSDIYGKFNSLPVLAKAAIAVGAAALAIAAPLVTIAETSKAGYIEAKHECKSATCNCVA